MRTIINPEYARLKPFIDRLADYDWFLRNGTYMHNGRNKVKLFEIDGIKVTVKSFEHVTLANKIIYCTVRKSKAVRAYAYSQRLRRMGIDTPTEIAAVEIRRGILLQYCYFVYLYTDYRPLKEATERFLENGAERSVLDGTAELIVRLHENGVLHNDLHMGNIMYGPDNQGGGCGHPFRIIDFNQMSFRDRLSEKQRMDNLKRLSCNLPAYRYILRRYALLAGWNPDETERRGIEIRRKFEERHVVRQKIKAPLKKLVRLFKPKKS